MSGHQSNLWPVFAVFLLQSSVYLLHVDCNGRDKVWLGLVSRGKMYSARAAEEPRLLAHQLPGQELAELLAVYDRLDNVLLEHLFSVDLRLDRADLPYQCKI